MEVTLLESVIGFTACSAVIIFAGIRLSRYGDCIAELTGLGKAWMGLIIMPIVTTLPELVTGISAAAIVNAPDLAAGNVFGSCVFNLMILSVLDSFMKKPITSVVHNSHIIAGSAGIILISLSGIGIFFSDLFPDVGWMSLTTIIIFAIYFISVLLLYKFDRKNSDRSHFSNTTKASSNESSLKQAIGYYLLNAVIVVVAALFLPFFGDVIANESGMGNTFFGTLFIAATTSLPELVVCISAVRMGSVDLAVGNLFGSNIFNVFILGLDDVFYRHGSFYEQLSQGHLLSIFVVIIMTAVAAIGLLFKANTKKFLLAFDTFIILALYIFLMLTLWYTR